MVKDPKMTKKKVVKVTQAEVENATIDEVLVVEVDNAEIKEKVVKAAKIAKPVNIDVKKEETKRKDVQDSQNAVRLAYCLSLIFPGTLSPFANVLFGVRGDKDEVDLERKKALTNMNVVHQELLVVMMDSTITFSKQYEQVHYWSSSMQRQVKKGGVLQPPSTMNPDLPYVNTDNKQPARGLKRCIKQFKSMYNSLCPAYYNAYLYSYIYRFLCCSI
jgi:hypothetical protein